MGLNSELSKIGREEGFKNSEDIYDTTTFKDFSYDRPEIKINLEESKIDEKKQKLLQETQKICSEMSKEFKKNFDKILKNYKRGEGQKISSKMMKHLKNTMMNRPSFTIEDSKDVTDKHLIVTFQLPKPLAQFWWKGKGDWGGLDQDIKGTAIEWGSFYRELMPVIWNKINEVSSNGIYLTRQNMVGDHDPKNYYYIWKVSKDDNYDEYNTNW